MGRTKELKNPRMIHFLEDEEFIQKMDEACILLDWNRSTFIRNACRAYIKVAVTKVQSIGEK